MQKYVNGVLTDLSSDEIVERADEEKKHAAKAIAQNRQKSILDLEATVTQRRLREAILTEDGKNWLQKVESQLAALRAPQ